MAKRIHIIIKYCLFISSLGIIGNFFTVFGSVSLGNEKNNGGDNKVPYYLHSRDMKNTTMVTEGKNKYFSTILNLDKKNGDLTLTAEATGNEIVEFNLEYNFKSRKFYEKIVGRYYYSTNNSKPSENSKKYLDPFQIDSNVTLGHYKPRFSDSEYKPRGTIQMYKGDVFSSKGKIWDLKIWEQLVEELEKDNDAVYKLCDVLILKVNDEFYWSYTPLIIDYKTMRAMKGVQQRLARNPPEASKETYREMKIIATDSTENGATILLDHKENHDH